MPYDDWDTLLECIQEGECVLFLGPGLPLVEADGSRSMPTRMLAEQMLEKLGGGAPGQEPAAESLPQIAQRLHAEVAEASFRRVLRGWHAGLEERDSALHDGLAALPFRLIVSGSHDPLMERALAKAGKIPSVEAYDYRGGKQQHLAVGNPRSPVLYHLFGRVAEPQSVVLTQTQQLEFLSALISKSPKIPDDLSAALQEVPLALFLGFGLGQWYLRILLHVLKVLKRRGLVAVEPEDLDLGPTPEDAILFYRDNYQVEIHREDVGGFVAELARRYVPPPEEEEEKESAAAAAAARALPSVFICHASEDAGWARKIHDALEGANLRPWLDKEALRGGHDWDDVIEKTIEKEADSFVVLVSRDLAAKTAPGLEPHYVIKEIKVALRKKDLYTRAFIIPAKVDDTPPPELLGEKLQFVDLTAEDGVKDLVKAIKLDLRA